ncbi:MAG: transposase, partial [Acidobacteria bacterium]|nr:transposase [Acidobacteriota bacterium]
MTTIPQALRRIKADFAQTLPQARVQQLADQLLRSWRQRTLTPVVTSYLFLQQILHGNTAVGELRHLSGLEFSDAAYCQARQRLPAAFFAKLHRLALGNCRADADADHTGLWRGHRLYSLDGSSFSMPDTAELQQQFGQPPGQAKGCGFPTAHLLVQFDLRNGYLLRALAAPCRTHDLAQAAVMHQDLRAGDVLLGDRAFCSYAHLALCKARGLYGVFRAHQRLLISFRPHRRHAKAGKVRPEDAGLPRSRWLKRLGQHDQVVEYFKPAQKPRWMTAEQYAAL